MTMNAKLKFGLATLVAVLSSPPLALAQGDGSGDAEGGMMQGEGMMGQDDMSGMMDMMRMTEQMDQMMEPCTGRMQAMTDQMNSAPGTPGAQGDRG